MSTETYQENPHDLCDSQTSVLTREFDSVVMLTWSNWYAEPRSNRYHYATRFARHVPVIFVQVDSSDELMHEERLTIGSPHPITVLRCPAQYDEESAHNLLDKLNRMGARRPLLWVYNIQFY